MPGRRLLHRGIADAVLRYVVGENYARGFVVDALASQPCDIDDVLLSLGEI
jgi:hypothetical protein